jgi:hypothetical protein
MNIQVISRKTSYTAVTIPFQDLIAPLQPVLGLQKVAIRFTILKGCLHILTLVCLNQQYKGENDECSVGAQLKKRLINWN